MEYKLSKDIFSKEAILKCLYWYSDDFSINVKTDKSNFIINLTPKNKIEKKKLNEIDNRLQRDFLDYNLRQIVKSETDDIRKLLIAKSLSNHDILDIDPPGDIEDPMGFDIKKI